MNYPDWANSGWWFVVLGIAFLGYGFAIAFAPEIKRWIRRKRKP